MKRIFLAFMILIVLSSCSFAAENDDVYVRKDLFEAYMKNIDSKLDTLLKEQSLMREDIKNIDKRLTKLESKVDGIYIALSNRIDGVEKRFDDLRSDVNIGVALIGLVAIFLGLPIIQRLWEKRQEAKQKYLKPEEIEKVFEKMFEAKMKGNLSNAI